MKIFEVRVDELPQGCQGCCLCRSSGSYGSAYICTAITEEENRNALGNVFDYMFRRHDCPLTVFVPDEGSTEDDGDCEA